MRQRRFCIKGGLDTNVGLAPSIEHSSGPNGRKLMNPHKFEAFSKVNNAITTRSHEKMFRSNFGHAKPRMEDPICRLAVIDWCLCDNVASNAKSNDLRIDSNVTGVRSRERYTDSHAISWTETGKQALLCFHDAFGS